MRPRTVIAIAIAGLLGAATIIVGMSGWFAAAAGPQAGPAQPSMIPADVQSSAAVDYFATIDKETWSPQFRRSYHAPPMANGVRIKLTAETLFGGDRIWMGEADQPDDRWVLFDPDHVADKIVDPEVVALVQSFIGAAHASDAEYMRLPPTSFIDENGVKWARATASPVPASADLPITGNLTPVLIGCGSGTTTTPPFAGQNTCNYLSGQVGH